MPRLPDQEITGALIRAARALAGITSATLAEDAGISVITIKRAETSLGNLSIRPATAEAIVSAFQRRGVGFIRGSGAGEGPGVILLGSPPD